MLPLLRVYASEHSTRSTVLRVLCIPIPVNASLYRLQTFFNKADTLPLFPRTQGQLTTLLPANLLLSCAHVNTSSNLFPHQGSSSPLRRAFRSCVLLQRRILKTSAQHVSLNITISPIVHSIHSPANSLGPFITARQPAVDDVDSILQHIESCSSHCCTGCR